MILRKAPLRRIGHWYPYYFSNSKSGISLTSVRKIKWHDLDFGLTKDGKWIITHGLPERDLLSTGRPRDYMLRDALSKSFKGYKVGRPRPLFRYAKRVGVNIEIEPKQGDKRYHKIKYWRRLARSAEAVWGKDWQKHVYVKVLDIHGRTFAVEVIKTASEAGFTAGPTRRWKISKKDL